MNQLSLWDSVQMCVPTVMYACECNMMQREKFKIWIKIEVAMLDKHGKKAADGPKPKGGYEGITEESDLAHQISG